MCNFYVSITFVYNNTNDTDKWEKLIKENTTIGIL